MKSKANIKTHPLHPILVCFPIAFFTGALIVDGIALLSGNGSDLERTGRLLVYAGICGAILAAVPGILDFIYTVPPQSSAKKRAARHGLMNTVLLLLFITAAVIRMQQFNWLVVMIELAGVILMCFSGWLGGTLVHRNQIGVDIRYADAGKWKEKHLEATSATVEVASRDELKVSQMMLLHINKKRIVLGRTEEGYVAFDDRCPHKGASLAAGSMIAGTVQCPWHGSQFDCSTGLLKAGPAKIGIKTYKVEMRGSSVILSL